MYSAYLPNGFQLYMLIYQSLTYFPRLRRWNLGGKNLLYFCRKHLYFPQIQGILWRTSEQNNSEKQDTLHWHGGGGLVCISQCISLWLYWIASLVYSLLAQLFCNLNTEALKKGIWNQGIVIILTLWCLVRAPGCGFKFWKGIPSKARSSCTAIRKYSEK